MKEEWNEGSLPLNLFLPTSAALPCCLIEWYWTSNWQKAFHSRLSPIKPPSLLVMSLFVCSLPNLHCLSFVCCLTEKGKKDLAEEHTRSLLAHLFRVGRGVGQFCDGLWPSANEFHFSKDLIVTGITGKEREMLSPGTKAIRRVGSKQGKIPHRNNSISL